MHRLSHGTSTKFGELQRTDSRMSNVYIIKRALSPNESECFGTECDLLRKTIGNCDLSELGCSIDIFENSILNDTHSARYDPDAYFRERWLKNVPEINDAETIKNFLLRKLPSIISKIHSSEKLHIFNESYIVKEPNSEIAFRWHTDANEQLAAIFPSHRTEYFSAWCPLDKATAENGTLAFPINTRIIELEMDRNSASGMLYSSPVEIASDCHEIDNISPSEDDSGQLLTVEIGTIVIFSSNTWHRSGHNRSLYPRRILYIQYSPIVISSTSKSPAGVAQLDSCVTTKSEEHSGAIQRTVKKSDVNLPTPLSFAILCALDVASIKLYESKYDQIEVERNHGMKKKRGRDT